MLANIVTVLFRGAIPCHRVGHNFKIVLIGKTMKRFVRCWHFTCPVQKIPASVHEYCNNHFWAAVPCQEAGHNFKVVL